MRRIRCSKWRRYLKWTHVYSERVSGARAWVHVKCGDSETVACTRADSCGEVCPEHRRIGCSQIRDSSSR